jgi:molybdopterin/thiamine biosynthesis adenylyltransferase
MENKFIRQQELVDQNKLSSLSVTIVGCGAVGSFTALSLAKMGIRQLTLIDHDEVSTENLSNQFFREEDLNRKKVVACMEILESFDSAVKVFPQPRPYVKGKLESDIVISSVDSMQVRKAAWQSVLRDKRAKLLIDPRMAAHVVQVYSVIPGDPSSTKAYEPTLVTDTQALPDRCTARSIIYTVLPLAALICRQVASFAIGDWIEPAITFDLKTLSLIKGGINSWAGK